MAMDMCQKCITVMKSNTDWYQIEFNRVAEAVCQTHPVITNRRVIRTLKTVKAFSLEPADTVISVGGIDNKGHAWGGKVKITLAGGHVHERSLKLKLFDYEAPFLDFLVQEGYLARHKGTRTPEEATPTTLTVTKAGDDLIRSSNLLAEAANDRSPLGP